MKKDTTELWVALAIVFVVLAYMHVVHTHVPEDIEPHGHVYDEIENE